MLTCPHAAMPPLAHGRPRSPSWLVGTFLHLPLPPPPCALGEPARARTTPADLRCSPSIPGAFTVWFSRKISQTFFEPAWKRRRVPGTADSVLVGGDTRTCFAYLPVQDGFGHAMRLCSHGIVWTYCSLHYGTFSYRFPRTAPCVQQFPTPPLTFTRDGQVYRTTHVLRYLPPHTHTDACLNAQQVLLDGDNKLFHSDTHSSANFPKL